MISFEGVPAIYFNSLFGKSNDEAKYEIQGIIETLIDINGVMKILQKN